MADAPVILVVEDNPVTRKMLRITLESEHYVVIEAGDARAALEAASERLPGLVLQDLILPDMNGFELLAELRNLPGAAELPILALSGFRGELEEGKGAAGFTAMLEKPIEPDALVEIVAAHLPKPAREETSIGAGRHIVLVDDDPAQLKLTRLQLVQLGFKITAVTSAAEGLAWAHRSPPDLVLSDVLMPEVDGFQLCMALRAEPRLAEVPVVLTSAHYHARADQELARHVGANALVLRTPDLAHVVPAIVQALRQGAASSVPGGDRVLLEHARAVIRQLARQTALGAELARRCTLQGAQLSLLGGIADALARRSNSDTALRDVLAATLDAAAISKGALFLQDERTGAYVLRHGIGFSTTELADAREFFGEPRLFERVIESRFSLTLPSNAIPEEVAEAVLRKANVATAEIVPLVSGGVGMGAIMLGARRTDMTSDDASSFARAIGSQIVASLELERSFERLAESERRYRTLMEHANDGIAVLSVDGIVREVNQHFSELLGVPRHGIVGRNLATFIAPEHARAVLECETHIVQGFDHGRSPVEIERQDGTTVLVEFSSAPLELQGERSILAIGRNVTAQVRAQTQLMISDRMASIGAMAASVAHEINNPLAAVVGNLECADESIRALAAEHGRSAQLEELEEILRDAREAADRVKVIVADTKLLSRSDESERGNVDVHRVLESALRMTRHEVRHRARFVRDYGEVPPVFAAECRLGQVFVNLIVNAAQAIPEGRANENEIRIRTRSGTHGSVVVEIEDTGAGIAPEDLRKVFAPFFTTKPKGVGTGLGLAICQRILGELGGEISLHSQRGRGTCVRLVLPGAHAIEDRPPLPARTVDHERRGKILVIDDEALVGTLLRRQLADQHDVTVLATAAEGLAHIRDGERYDVILCDLMMPTMTGAQFHRQLEKLAPDQTERIVFLTGGAFTPTARAFLQEGPKTWLDKPFDACTLRTLIQDRLR